MSDKVLKQLFGDARAHGPFDIERAGYGLETRVLARMRAEGKAAAGALEDFGKWAWRSAFGVAAVVALLVVWLCVWSGFSVEAFAYDPSGDLASYLPISFGE